ncbi:unnamed protein product [Spirodela intermedia]|uniref:Cytochrome b5 heme-binding domain-containing protein n=1 Tax=Spirodela intermedia TaxID=51605 RepID=A0A7I8JDE0_SPIIN|nr:unnamed protein product [Spirodela intermedia]CAA6668011.1 unnamed protein product [Spirodela intermedia]
MGGADGGKGVIYTLADVSKHNTHEDCWLVIDGKVYDVTKFLDDHPGGDDVLLSSTVPCWHIDTATIPTKVKYTPPKQPHYNHDKTTDFVIRILQFLLPVVILGLAVGVRYYTKSD